MISFHRVLITTGIVFCAGFAIWPRKRAGLTYFLRNLQRFIGR